MGTGPLRAELESGLVPDGAVSTPKARPGCRVAVVSSQGAESVHLTLLPVECLAFKEKKRVHLVNERGRHFPTRDCLSFEN